MDVVEIWKPVALSPQKYEVSNLGNIRSLIFKNRVCCIPKVRLMSQCNQSGYRVVTIYFGNGEFKQCHVHRLVMEAFVENPEGKKTVNHKNGIRHDNRLENLEWATPSENIQHAVDTGLKPKLYGTTAPYSKLTDQKVLEIRRIAAQGMRSHADIGREFGVSQSVISRIKSRQAWPHI